MKTSFTQGDVWRVGNAERWIIEVSRFGTCITCITYGIRDNRSGEWIGRPRECTHTTFERWARHGKRITPVLGVAA